MKIDDAMNGIPAIRSRETRKTKGGSTPSTTGAGKAGDSVALTPASAQLNRLEEELGNIGNHDAGKVESIRQAIAEGQFRVDERAVADALVDNAMDQMRRQGKPRR